MTGLRGPLMESEEQPQDDGKVLRRVWLDGSHLGPRGCNCRVPSLMTYGWKGRRVAASAKERGLRHGYRSGLEAVNAEHLKAKGQKKIRFEAVKIKYVVPSIERTYSLDFELDNGIMIETKGIFDAIDRAKHLFIKTQHPELDIRFVFSNPNARIAKRSPTTYAVWCEKYGFQFAAKVVPDAWLLEAGPHGRPGIAGGKRIIPVSQEVKDDLIGPARQPHQAISPAARGASAVAGKKARPAGHRVSSDTRPNRRKPPRKAH